METSFPRGGGDHSKSSSKRTRRNEDQPRRSSIVKDKDFLFQSSSDFDNQKSKKRLSNGGATKENKRSRVSSSIGSLGQLGGGMVTVKQLNKVKHHFIEPLSFKRIHSGMKLLGIVRQLEDDFAVISLPNMFSGYIRRKSEKGEPPLTKVISLHQVLATVVVKTASEAAAGGVTTRRRIELSILPNQVNAGYDRLLTGDTRGDANGLKIRGRISSIEDHGTVVDVGIPGVLAFLPLENVEGFSGFDHDDSDGRGDESSSTSDDEASDSDNDVITNKGGNVNGSSYESRRQLREGMIIDAIVKSKSEQRQRPFLTLSLPMTSKFAKYEDDEALAAKFQFTIKALVPGMKVNCVVEGHAQNGLLVSFLTHFRGAIDWNHLGGIYTEESWKKSFTKGSLTTIQARILAVDSATKLIRLTMLPHLMNMTLPPSFPTTLSEGVIVENNCITMRIDNGIGVLLGITPDTNKKDEQNERRNSNKKGEYLQNPEYLKALSTRAIYIHVSKAVDEVNKPKKDITRNKTDLTKLFKVGKIVPKVRILATTQALIEGWASGTTANAAVSKGALMGYEDVKVASIHRGVEILKIMESGILVALGNKNIKALCANMHLSDTQFEKKALLIKQRLTVGKKLDSVRVLAVDAEKRRCTVSMKATLIRDKSDPLCSFSECKPGEVYTGYITKVSPKGINVMFYNNVHGFITAKSLARDAGVDDPMENYETGATLVCRVISSSQREGNSYLGLTLASGYNADLSSGNRQSSEESESIIPGTILKSGRVIKMVFGEESIGDDGINFDPGFAVVHYSKPISLECHLSFSQLADKYDEDCSNKILNALASKLLKVGKKVKSEAVVLESASEVKPPSISLKPMIFSSISASSDDSPALIPSSAESLFVGAVCAGYVARIDSRFGAFVRFMNGLTGLIPKLRKGCEMPLFETLFCKVIALDAVDSENPKILLQRTSKTGNSNNRNKLVDKALLDLNVGDKIGKVHVVSVDFNRANLSIVDKKYSGGQGRVRLHLTMASSDTKANQPQTVDKALDLPKHHPFKYLHKGDIISDLHVVGVEVKNDIPYIELSNLNGAKLLITKELETNSLCSGVVTSYAAHNGGVWLSISPSVSGFVSGLELTKDASMLESLERSFPIGTRIDVMVIRREKGRLDLSALMAEEKKKNSNFSFHQHAFKPKRGDLVVGRINRLLETVKGPALMMSLRGQYIARCCLTELNEKDDWVNMPIGKDVDLSFNENDDITTRQGDFFHGKYVSCRILGSSRKHCMNISLRKSRIEGNLEVDTVPTQGDIIQAYVENTNRKGCFVRISSQVRGRIILKELSQDFVPDPVSTFPPGRLIRAKVKSSSCSNSMTTFDLDMRESSLLENDDMVKFEDLEEGSKVKGTISRVERFGVFVKLDNSHLTGMSHLSECSDKFVEKLEDLFDPGDRVKALILDINTETKRISLGLKASYFTSDDDSSSESEDDSSAMSVDEDDISIDSDSSPCEESSKVIIGNADSETSEDEISDSDDDVSDPNSSSASEDESDQEALDDVKFDWDIVQNGDNSKDALVVESDSDTDDSDSDDSEDSAAGKKRKHNSRTKALKRKREEAEVSRLENRLADGTADENPVTSGDFERLLATDPNSSETYIRYMAHYLSLSDIDGARGVAERAFKRIVFREEGEKLNVWTALLALEIKYGSEKSFHDIIDRAANQNNPKQVYLRVCEMLEKEVERCDSLSTKSKGYEESVQKADEMFAKMCKKFKSKKTVWVARMQYLLKQGRHDEAQEVLKRSILSLPGYKHIAVVSKLAQLEFEFGSKERARTLFDGLLEKYIKRLDLAFVYVDKELKYGGGVNAARSLFMRIIHPSGSRKKKSFSDKQMKSVFKKWFKVEEEFGDMNSQERVKAEARAYVERSS